MAEGSRLWPNLAAGLLVATTLVVFFAWTYPANQETNSWTAIPANWENLRTQWEFSNASNALLAFAALCCTALSRFGGKPA